MLTRRTVLKAIAAAVMAPTIRLRPEIPDEQLLMAFCDPDAWRYDFTRPFGHGSLTYATDSRAMIRCELAGRQEDGERRLPRTIDDVWAHYWLPGDWRPLTPDDLQPTERVTGSCPYCGDRRVSFGENYPTDEDSAESLPDWDVDDNTIRDVTCEYCQGREYQGPACVRIGGVQHQSWTLRRILALPNPMVCRSRRFDFYGGTLIFRADGFEGISMGMRND